MDRRRRFLALLRHQQGYLERVALAMLGNWPDVEDALQEAILAGYQHFDQLRGGEEAFPAWMRRILVRTCSAALRRRQRLVPLAEVGERPGPTGDEPLQAAEGQEMWQRVAHLNDTLRPVVVMRYLLDMTQPEIAEALGIPLGTVKSRLGKALAILRQEFEPRAAKGREGR